MVYEYLIFQQKVRPTVLVRDNDRDSLVVRAKGDFKGVPRKGSEPIKGPTYATSYSQDDPGVPPVRYLENPRETLQKWDVIRQDSEDLQN